MKIAKVIDPKVISEMRKKIHDPHYLREAINGIAINLSKELYDKKKSK